MNALPEAIIDYAVEHITALCGIPSPTGYTREAEAYVHAELCRLGYQPEYTTKRSVRVRLGGQGRPLVFTNYEEVGHSGSAGLPHGISEILAVDMGAMGDDLGTDDRSVSICAKDSGGPYDLEVTNRLIELAKVLELRFAVDIYPFYGSDAGAALRAGYDIRHGLIGPGVQASHGYERTHRLALQNTLALITAYCCGKD